MEGLRSGNNTFTWIPTREGLTSRFLQMELIHSQLRAHGRALRVVDNPSSHYKDTTALRLCDIFLLPASIICSSVSPNVVVHKTNCFIDDIKPEQAHRVKGYCVREAYTELVPRIQAVDWATLSCGLLFGFNFQILHETDRMDVIFLPRLVALFEKVRDNLGYSFKAGNYLVAHWRRGDQVGRCKIQESKGNLQDTSVNCGTAQDLIDSIRAFLSVEQPGVLPLQVYVATNEKSTTQINLIRNSGFKVLADGLSFHDIDSLTSVEVFAIELQLMANARKFVGWGITGVQSFVKRIRGQKLNGYYTN